VARDPARVHHDAARLDVKEARAKVEDEIEEEESSARLVGDEEPGCEARSSHRSIVRWSGRLCQRGRGVAKHMPGRAASRTGQQRGADGLRGSIHRGSTHLPL
jgi:hypothetical protein